MWGLGRLEAPVPGGPFQEWFLGLKWRSGGVEGKSKT